MNMLQKVAKRGKGERTWKLEGKRLSRDPRFARLIDSVRVHCPSFRAREGANVVHALGVLQADIGALSVDGELAAQLTELVERVARTMKPQEVANSLNGLSKIEAAAAVVTPLGWAGLAEAAGRTAREMKPQEIANTLNALGKLKAAALVVSASGWAGPAEAVGRTARKMNQRDVANTLNALPRWRRRLFRRRGGRAWRRQRRGRRAR